MDERVFDPDIAFQDRLDFRRNFAVRARGLGGYSDVIGYQFDALDTFGDGGGELLLMP